MKNEEIIKECGKPENWISLSDLLDLARADEREKMTDEKVKEYFAGLNGKETAWEWRNDEYNTVSDEYYD